uniref:Uncharacterized protein n=1 Tax=Rhodnius prolixus TaxID=13249 RepID=T1IFC4_RHOPR
MSAPQLASAPKQHPHQIQLFSSLLLQTETIHFNFDANIEEIKIQMTAPQLASAPKQHPYQIQLFSGLLLQSETIHFNFDANIEEIKIQMTAPQLASAPKQHPHQIQLFSSLLLQTETIHFNFVANIEEIKIQMTAPQLASAPKQHPYQIQLFSGLLLQSETIHFNFDANIEEIKKSQQSSSLLLQSGRINFKAIIFLTKLEVMKKARSKWLYYNLPLSLTAALEDPFFLKPTSSINFNAMFGPPNQQVSSEVFFSTSGKLVNFKGLIQNWGLDALVSNGFLTFHISNFD